MLQRNYDLVGSEDSVVNVFPGTKDESFRSFKMVAHPRLLFPALFLLRWLADIVAHTCVFAAAGGCGGVGTHRR